MNFDNLDANLDPNLDPWRHRYADRASFLKSSEIRALFAVATRPEIVSLAGGMPYLDGMPFKEMGEKVKELIETRGTEMWQYGAAQGFERLRELVLDICGLEGVKSTKENVVITSGSQQALDYITRIFINPGDVVLAEAPNYVGALGVFRSYQARVQNVKIDKDGIIPEKFEQLLERLDRAGERVKFLYTVPNFHNPAGVTMSEERRPKILEICKKYGILIVEDNPYGLLSFDGSVLPSIYSYDYDSKLGFAPNVVYLGSFSKIMAPGFRVGWMVAPNGIRDKLVLSSESAILCPSNASQMTLVTYLENFDWKKQIRKFREIYKERHSAMVEALGKYLPNCTYNDPTGGFYIWLKVPEGINTKAIQNECLDAGVAYVPGRGFYADGKGDDHMRLSFCFPTPEQITEGIKRLSTVINKY
ncbi:MAG: PLP-dependent aminotransferase family protein [Candidatus Ancillula sp.]|jgi:DNA-binding transcriptional MocR family regulator|nr:PLP-dependent aminotransferase family protein [Candidatus Ancillula sp.]